MTDKQEKVYYAIKNYIDENGYSPTVRELCKMVRLNSPASVHGILKRLKEKGYIDYIYNHNRTLRIVKEINNEEWNSR